MLSGMNGLDRDDSRPAYQQVKERIRDAIKAGALAPGDQLPSHRALADEHGVATETVKRALNELRAEGLIVTRQGKGSYVRTEITQRAETAQPSDIDDVRAQVAELARRMDALERRLADQ
jgi:DNA-binding GntR family transcriptional regulator